MWINSSDAELLLPNMSDSPVSVRVELLETQGVRKHNYKIMSNNIVLSSSELELATFIILLLFIVCEDRLSSCQLTRRQVRQVTMLIAGLKTFSSKAGSSVKLLPASEQRQRMERHTECCYFRSLHPLVSTLLLCVDNNVQQHCPSQKWRMFALDIHVACLFL